MIFRQNLQEKTVLLQLLSVCEQGQLEPRVKGLVVLVVQGALEPKYAGMKRRELTPVVAYQNLASLKVSLRICEQGQVERGA